MVLLSNRDFAFIMNVDSFLSPYLVEMSRRKKIKERHVNCYKPNAIFTPPKMNFIFQLILNNGPLFKMHLQVIKETMLEAIVRNNEDTLANGSILQTLGVESMV
jgi:hypothetical protein